MPNPARRPISLALAASLALLPLLVPIGVSGASASPSLPSIEDGPGYRVEDVSFRSGDTQLQGSVLVPDGTATDRPAVVVVAGAGPGPRDRYLDHATAFARAGIVTLVYDKRADYTRATSSFDALANDAVAGVDLLRTRPEVDPERVGVWGHSEGGWVGPLAAARSPEVAFVVAVGASGLPADTTQLWSNRTRLRHAGVTPRLIEPIGVDLSRMLIAAQLYGDTAHDPAATLRDVEQPVLAVFSAQDRTAPPADSMRIFERELAAAGNGDVTLAVIDGVDHEMLPSADGFVHADGATPDAAYVDLVTRWILDPSAHAPGVDAIPDQIVPTTPTAPLRWYESPVGHVIWLAVLAIAFLAFPIAVGVGRVRRRRTAVEPHRLEGTGAAVTLSVSGLLMVVGTTWFLWTIVLSGATGLRTAVLGRPPEWAVLQSLAVVTLAGTIATGIALWRHRDREHARRLVVPLAAGALSLPWAAYWGLLTIG